MINMPKNFDGYVTTQYTSGYYSNITPASLEMFAVIAGVNYTLKSDMKYLELGCGQGISLLFNAASQSGGEFWGVDFNASHILNAQTLAKKAGIDNVIFSEDSFEDFLQRDDIPMFDMITLHGIWSWVSSENHARILEIIRRHLVPGGLVYVSYNAAPGAWDRLPLRHFLRFYESQLSDKKDSIEQRTRNSVLFFKKIFESDSIYLNNDSMKKKHFEFLEKQRNQYIVHEYLNEHWNVSSFQDMGLFMRTAKMEHVCTCDVLQRFTNMLPSALKSLVGGIQDPLIFHTIVDYFYGTSFRCDIFIKGRNALPITTIQKRMDSLYFFSHIPLHVRESIPVKFASSRGEVNATENTVRCVLEALEVNEDEYKLKSFKYIRKYMQKHGFDFDQTLSTLAFLLDSRNITNSSGGTNLCKESKQLSDKCTHRVHKLNLAILEQALLYGCDCPYVFSPLGVQVVALNRIEQCMLLAYMAMTIAEKEDSDGGSEQIARVTCATLKILGNNITRQDGQAIDSKEQMIETLIPMAKVFMKKNIPLLKRMHCFDYASVADEIKEMNMAYLMEKSIKKDVVDAVKAVNVVQKTKEKEIEAIV